jgi:hypothetical protein
MVMWEIPEEFFDLEKVENNEPITTEIRDAEGDMVWRLAKVMVSDKYTEEDITGDYAKKFGR